MTQPLFPSTIGTPSRFAKFLIIKTVVRKFGKSDGQTGSPCLDKAVLVQGGGGVKGLCSRWGEGVAKCCHRAMLSHNQGFPLIRTCDNIHSEILVSIRKYS